MLGVYVRDAAGVVWCCCSALGTLLSVRRGASVDGQLCRRWSGRLSLAAASGWLVAWWTNVLS